MMLLFGLASCGDSGAEEPTTGPSPTSTASDGGGESPAGGGDAPDGGDGGESKGDDPDGEAARGASDGGGEQVVADDKTFPEPNPADFPGMNTHTEQGAMETVKYFWAQAYWSAWSGKFATVESLYTDECASCEEVVESARDSYREGAYLSPSSTIPLDIKATPDYEDYEMVVDYNFDENPTEESRKYDGASHGTAAAVEWVDGEWVIVALETHSREGDKE